MRAIYTAYGLSQLAAANTNNPLDITHIAYGDGDGSAVVANGNETALVNELARHPLDFLKLDPSVTDNTQYLAGYAIPKTVGGFTIREVGLFDATGLVVYAAWPESYKPLITEGAATELTLTVALRVNQADTVNVIVSSSDQFATQNYVDFCHHRPTVNGPNPLDETTLGTYTITNYSFEKSYTVSTAFGSATISGDTIQFTPGTYAQGVSQNFTITVAGFNYDYPVDITALQPPGTVGNFTYPATSDDDQLLMNWDAATNVGSYTIESSFDGAAFSVLASNLTGTSYQATGLADGDYIFRIKAVNSDGDSAYTTGTTCQVRRVPATVTGITYPASDNDGSITVTWNASSFATDYSLLQSINGGAFVEIANGITGTSHTVNGLLHASSYQYALIAHNDNASTQSATAQSAITCTVLIPPAPITGLTYPTSNNTGSFTLSFTGSATADSYDIEQRINDGSFVSLQNITGTSVNLTRTDNNYVYRVRARNGGGVSDFVTGQTLSVLLTPSAPASITVPSTSDSASVAVSWAGVSDATSYELDVHDGSSWSNVLTGFTPINHTLTLADGTYKVRVRAFKTGAGFSPYIESSNVVVEIRPDAVPSVTYSSNPFLGTVISVSWSLVSHADSYIVSQQFQTDNFHTDLAPSGATTTTKFIPGQSNDNPLVRYGVRAVNGTTASAITWGPYADTTITPEAPTSITYPSTDSDGAVTVNWSSSANASQYRLERETAASGSWVLVAITSSLSFNVTGLADNTYRFRVRAEDSGLASGFTVGANLTVNSGSGGGGGGCFILGTEIIMADGTIKAMEDCEPGESVRSKLIPGLPDGDQDYFAFTADNLDGIKTTTAIIKTVHFDTYDHYYIVNERLMVTGEHPFYSERDGVYQWRRARDLMTGDSIVNEALETIMIDSYRRIDNTINTVNLDVETDDIYIVDGALQLMAHNSEKN